MKWPRRLLKWPRQFLKTTRQYCTFAVLFSALGVLSTGCTVFSSFAPPSAESLQAWQARKPHLQQLQTWQFVGRVAIKADVDSWSGIIYWDQQPGAYQIDFKTPLGQSMLQLQGDADGATLKLPNKKQYHADDAESLIYNAVGWGLPIKTLASWVTGVPAPDGYHEFKIDEQGRLLRLKQSDWDIHYKRYALTDERELPKKMYLESDELTIRLIIDKWALEEI